MSVTYLKYIQHKSKRVWLAGIRGRMNNKQCLINAKSFPSVIQRSWQKSSWFLRKLSFAKSPVSIHRDMHERLKQKPSSYHNRLIHKKNRTGLDMKRKHCAAFKNCIRSVHINTYIFKCRLPRSKIKWIVQWLTKPIKST